MISYYKLFVKEVIPQDMKEKATACWGLENNCTRSISAKSTYQIVTIKGFGSGTGSLIVAIVLGEKLPELRYIL